MSNTYNRMLAHHAEHIFKRGPHKGAAPLDAVRRYGHTHITVAPSHADVICYQHIIFRAYPDGRMRLALDMCRSNRAKAAINKALSLFHPLGKLRVYSRFRHGFSQMHYEVSGTAYAFYDGMLLDSSAVPLTPKPFRRRVSTAPSFAALSQPFRQAFPTLHAALSDTMSRRNVVHAFYEAGLGDPPALARAITHQPELWPAIVEYYSFPYVFWDATPKIDADEALTTLMAVAERALCETVDTDVHTYPGLTVRPA